MYIIALLDNSSLEQKRPLYLQYIDMFTKTLKVTDSLDWAARYTDDTDLIRQDIEIVTKGTNGKLVPKVMAIDR